jgi:predicted translin family RNA/ssDNA-binding protein
LEYQHRLTHLLNNVVVYLCLEQQCWVGCLSLRLQAKAHQQQQADKTQKLLRDIAHDTATLIKDQKQQADVTQQSLQDIADSTSNLTEYLTPHPRATVGLQGARCLLVHEMVDAVAEVLDDRL